MFNSGGRRRGTVMALVAAIFATFMLAGCDSETKPQPDGPSNPVAQFELTSAVMFSPVPTSTTYVVNGNQVQVAKREMRDGATVTPAPETYTLNDDAKREAYELAQQALDRGDRIAECDDGPEYKLTVSLANGMQHTVRSEVCNPDELSRLAGVLAQGR